MRRAVTDQIKALNELSDIVTKHGSHLDVSSPRVPEARAPIRDTAPRRPGALLVPQQQCTDRAKCRSWPS
jgi:hypothetical protein